MWFHLCGFITEPDLVPRTIFGANGCGLEMATREPTAIVQLKVRLREPLRAMLEAEAKKWGVSLNQIIVTRLEDSFETDIEKRIIALENNQEAIRMEYLKLQMSLSDSSSRIADLKSKGKK